MKKSIIVIAAIAAALAGCNDHTRYVEQPQVIQQQPQVVYQQAQVAPAPVIINQAPSHGDGLATGMLAGAALGMVAGHAMSGPSYHPPARQTTVINKTVVVKNYNNSNTNFTRNSYTPAPTHSFATSNKTSYKGMFKR